MRNRITELRTGRGLTQEALGDLLHVTRRTVISLEKGRYDPSLPVAFRLSAVFGVPIEAIFQPDDEDLPGPH